MIVVGSRNSVVDVVHRKMNDMRRDRATEAHILHLARPW